jgi:hypothetical protein
VGTQGRRSTRSRGRGGVTSAAARQADSDSEFAAAEDSDVAAAEDSRGGSGVSSGRRGRSRSRATGRSGRPLSALPIPEEPAVDNAGDEGGVRGRSSSRGRVGRHWSSSRPALDSDDEGTIAERVAKEHGTVAARVVADHVHKGDHVFDDPSPGLGSLRGQRTPRQSRRAVLELE